MQSTNTARTERYPINFVVQKDCITVETATMTMVSLHHALLVMFRCHGKGSYSYGIPFCTLGGERSLLDSNATGTPRSVDHVAIVVVTYALYACVADCADAMADAWEDTAGYAQAICLHENLLK